MKLTKTEVDHLIATEVHGWLLDDDHGTCCHPTTREWRKPYTRTLKTGESFDSTALVYFQSDFAPTDDIDQALDALEAWCDKNNKPARWAYLPRPSNGLYSIGLGGWDHEIEAENESLPLAICAALASAVNGEQVTIEETK
jgi:hypothetical protein